LSGKHISTWNKHYQDTQHILGIENDQIVWKSISPDATISIRKCSGEDFLDGDLQDEVRDIFEVGTLSEAIAVLRFSRLPEEQKFQPTNHSSLKGRPQYKRFFGENTRGVHTSNVWFFGRKVAVDIVGKARETLSLQELSQKGLSAVHRQALGDKWSDIIEQAAQDLAPLPCMCGTGCREPEEHGSLQVLSRCRVPNIPVDHDVCTCRCKVCGRWWTFERISAFRYTPEYKVYPFEP